MATKVPQHLAVKADPERYARKLAYNRASYLRRKAAGKLKASETKKDPFKVRARHYIANRLYRGKISRMPCVICGNNNSHAHHEDYSRPLYIAWLCQKHHSDVHANKLCLSADQMVDLSVVVS